jgi:hypothetical protein
MLLSTLKVIIPQLDDICDKLGVAKGEHRNAVFTPPRGDSDQYLPGGLIVVDIGEVHVSSAYRLNFDIKGNLVGVFQMFWDPRDGISYLLMDYALKDVGVNVQRPGG